MRLFVLFLTAVVISGAAAAQSGPAPGYGSATDYAQDYATGTAAAAQEDPQGFVQDHGEPKAVENETAHALYMACWAADDQGVQHDACDPYYIPRGEARPEQPEEPMVQDPAVNATDAFVGELAGVVEDIVADPTTAPDQVDRVAEATTRFLGRVIGIVEDIADGIIDAVEDLIDLGDGIGAGIEGVGLGAADGLSDGVTVAAGGVADAAQATLDGAATGAIWIGDGIVVGASAIGDGLGKAASATGDGLLAAGSAIGDGIAAAAKATGHGIQASAGAIADGAMAVVGAIGDGLAAIGDAIKGVFEDETDIPDRPEAADLPEIDLPEVSLLDGISPMGQ